MPKGSGGTNKVSKQLQQHNLTPEQAFYLATLGGAVALDMADKIGNFAVGKEADFLLLDPQATPLLQFRWQYCQTWREQLFALQTLADDRVVYETNILGVPVQLPAMASSTEHDKVSCA